MAGTWFAVWLSGSTLVSINEVSLRRARLALGWIIVCGCVFTSVYDQPLNSAFYPQWDGNGVPVKVRLRFAAEE